MDRSSGAAAGLRYTRSASESEVLLRAHVERRSSRPIGASEAPDVKKGLLAASIYPALGARIISHPRPLLERQGSPLDRHSRRSHARSFPNTARRSPRAVSILIWNAAFAIIVGVRLCLYSSGKRTSPIVGKARLPGSGAATPSPSMSSACPPIFEATFVLWP
jgi:hypothetical protein